MGAEVRVAPFDPGNHAVGTWGFQGLCAYSQGHAGATKQLIRRRGRRGITIVAVCDAHAAPHLPPEPSS